MSIDKFEVSPIAVARTPYDSDFTPKQPLEREAKEGQFCVVVSKEFEAGLDDLEKCTHIILISYFDKVSGNIKLKVTPPMGEDMKVGLFASRSPKRPNPLGLHIVKLNKIEGNKLYTSPLDMFDNTPILDIKPYFLTLDAKPDANDGWFEELENKEHLIDHLLARPHDHNHTHDHEKHHHSDKGHDHADHDHKSDHHHHDKK